MAIRPTSYLFPVNRNSSPETIAINQVLETAQSRQKGLAFMTQAVAVFAEPVFGSAFRPKPQDAATQQHVALYVWNRPIL